MCRPPKFIPVLCRTMIRLRHTGCAYQLAPGDVKFAKAVEQEGLMRDPIIHYTSNGRQMPRDVTLYALFAVVAISPLVLRWRRRS